MAQCSSFYRIFTLKLITDIGLALTTVMPCHAMPLPFRYSTFRLAFCCICRNGAKFHDLSWDSRTGEEVSYYCSLIDTPIHIPFSFITRSYSNTFAEMRVKAQLTWTANLTSSIPSAKDMWPGISVARWSLSQVTGLTITINFVMGNRGK